MLGEGGSSGVRLPSVLAASVFWGVLEHGGRFLDSPMLSSDPEAQACVRNCLPGHDAAPSRQLCRHLHGGLVAGLCFSALSLPSYRGFMTLILLLYTAEG